MINFSSCGEHRIVRASRLFPLEVLHVTELSVWRAGAAYFDPARTHNSAYLSLLDRCSWPAIYV